MSSLIVTYIILKLFINVTPERLLGLRNDKFLFLKNKSYLISSILILFTISIIFFKGLNLGIDFKGGLNFEIKSDLSKDQISQIFEDFDSSKEILIKKEIGSDVYTIRIESGDDNASLIEEVNAILNDNSNLEILLSEYIEPTFSDELIKNSIYALASSLLVIAFMFG